MSTLTLTNRQLRQLIEPVVPFAHTDGRTLALECVRIRSQSYGLVTAEAAGDYQAGLCRRVFAGGCAPGFDALIPARSLRELIDRTQDVLDGGRVMTFNPDPDHAEVTVIVHAAPGARASAMVFDAVDPSRFPDVPAILAKTIRGVGFAPTSAWSADIDPTRIAEFFSAHAQGNPSGAPLAVHPGRMGAPLVVTCGQHFIGLLSPSLAKRRATKWAPTTVPPWGLAKWGDYLDEVSGPAGATRRVEQLDRS